MKYFLLVCMILASILSISVAAQAQSNEQEAALCDQSLLEFIATVFTPEEMSTALAELSQQDTGAQLPQLMLVAVSLNRRLENAANLFSQGQFAEALAGFKQINDDLKAIPVITETRFGRNVYSLSLFTLAAAYSNLGQYSDALAIYEEALQIQRESGMNLIEGPLLSEMGVIYRARGEYARALAVLNEALELERTTARRRCMEGLLTNNLGMIYFMQGDTQTAGMLLEQAIASHEATGDLDSQAVAYTNLGDVYLANEQNENSERSYLRAIELWEQTDLRWQADSTYLSLGTLKFQTGETDAALEYFERAISIGQEYNNIAGRATALATRGNAYLLLGDYEAARADFEASLIDSKALMLRQNEAGVLAGLGWLAILEEDYESAAADLAESVAIYEELMKGAVVDDAVTEIARSSTVAFELLAQLKIIEDDVQGAFAVVERGRAYTIRAELSNTNDDLHDGVSEALIAQDEELRRVIAEAQNLVDAYQDGETSDTDITAARNNLRQLQSEQDRLQERMRAESSMILQQVVAEVASWDEIVSAVPPNTAMLLYDIGDFVSVVYVIADGKITPVELGAEATNALLNETITTHRLRPEDVSKLSSLYTLLVKPVRDQIQGYPELIISPDGSLNYLSFAALRDEHNEFMVDHFAISSIPSATTLHLLAERRDQQSPPAQSLILSQPIATDLPDLRFAGQEAEKMGRALNIPPYLSATEADLRAGIAGAGVLALVAHGELDSRFPMNSVIHLAPAGEYDGHLIVREIYELDSPNGLELVVLSGCDTGTGIGDGQDFGLLNRAFLAIGARRVVASLRPVNDENTANLMSYFMEARQAGESDAVALQAAMKRAKDVDPSPEHWASFVLTGLP